MAKLPDERPSQFSKKEWAERKRFESLIEVMTLSKKSQSPTAVFGADGEARLDFGSQASPDRDKPPHPGK